ncbi:hydrolase [Enterococcus faecium]|nr:hydrolase [Enterococcus faecium]
MAPCDSELNGRLTTSFLNGVQKLASAVISSANSKTRKAVFAWLFLLLVAGQLFHNLSTKRCSIS